LAQRIAALYLRIDTIEHAILSAGVLPSDAEVGPAGYMAACGVAADNLRLGRSVIADSVNPIRLTRDAYRDVAIEAGVPFIEVEVACSDASRHRERVETRSSGANDLAPPTWEQVEKRRYEPWDRPHLRLDTASLSVAESVQAIVEAIQSGASR
jgi:predicted kinase